MHGSDRVRRHQCRSLPAALCLMAVMAACVDRPSEGPAGVVVAVSVPPQAYFVERLAGDLVRIELMLPQGGNPHVYEPTFQQVRALAEAAVYVKVGHPKFSFEGAWLDRLLADNDTVRVVECVRGMELETDDPHVWMSPRQVRAMLPHLAAALGAALPEGRATIDRNLAAFTEDIDRLDEEIREQLSDVRTPRFYVMHAAFGYFARDYGLQQVAFESGAREPDPRQVALLVARARRESVSVLFTQPQSSRRQADLVAGEIGARVVEVDPLARDWLKNLRSFSSALQVALGT